jgi:hypothetical protein
LARIFEWGLEVTPAERMAKARARRRAGRMLLKWVDIDQDAVPHALVALGVLDRAHLDDEAEIARAAAKILNALPHLGVARNVTDF